MDAMLADWRLLLVILGLTCFLGGLVWTVRRHAKILNGDLLTRLEKNLATLNERANTHAEDIRGLHGRVATETDKREASITRLHDRLTKMGCK